MTIEDFAEHLGVAARTVAKWEARGSTIAPVPLIQEVLDTALERATPAQQERFETLRAEGQTPSAGSGLAARELRESKGLGGIVNESPVNRDDPVRPKNRKRQPADDFAIEEERTLILHAVNDAFSGLTIARLPEQIDAFEAFVRSHFRRRAIQRICEWSCVSESSGGGQYLVGPNLEYYEFEVLGGQPLQPDTLCVALVRRCPGGSGVIRRYRSVRGYGPYRRLEMVLPRELAEPGSLLADVAQVIIETAYAWIEQEVIALVSREDIGIARELYRRAAAILPEQELQGALWFASVGPLYGFRLMDRSVTIEALHEIDRHITDYGNYTLKFLAELLATRLPREQTLMQRALSLDKCLDVDLHDAEYHKRGHIYASVLAALYGREAFTIYPVMNTENVSVVGLFPTHMGVIARRLDHHTDDLLHICRSMSEQILNASVLFEKGNRSSLLEIENT
jgi:hypothetical protein